MMQLVYGDDGLDPSDMESNNTPVSFTHIHAHSRATAPWRPHDGPPSLEDSLSDLGLIQAVLGKMNSPDFLSYATNMVTRFDFRGISFFFSF
jgi:hypothetical protein